jgi:hypothetical protein
VAQERPCRGLGHDRALVADDRVGEPGSLEVGTNRPEHPAGDDDDVQASLASARKRSQRTRPQHPVLRNQRAVEIGRDERDVVRKAVGERQLCVD